MRIALLSYRSKPHCGGQGVYVGNLSRELARLGHRVEVFSGPPYPELDAGVALTTVPGLDLYREPDPLRTPGWGEFRTAIDVVDYATMVTGGFAEPYTFSHRVARLLGPRRTDFDVVLDNQCLGPGLLHLNRPDRHGRAPALAATIHHPISVDRRVELDAAVTAAQRLRIRRWYGFVRMQRRVARRIPRVLTVSRSSAAEINRDFGVPPERIRVTGVGVDPAVFHPGAATGPDRVPGRIVAVASADTPLKGVPVLLEALAKMRTELDARLVLVTPDPGRRRAGGLRQRCAALGLDPDAVRTVDGLDPAELAALYRSAEVAVVPSLYEGFSLPAIEAMACATPLVATATGALPEVVGEAAVLVTPGEADALAAAVSGLLAQPARRRRLGAAGHARVSGRFTWAAVAAATAEHLADAVSARDRVHRC